MSNPVFPTLSRGQDSSLYSVELEDASLKTTMEGGYVVSRAKHTRPARKTFHSGFTFITDADRATLETFYGTTVRGGSVVFDWQDPPSLAIYQVRFVGPLQFKYVGRGDTRRWDVTFALEQA